VGEDQKHADDVTPAGPHGAARALGSSWARLRTWLLPMVLCACIAELGSVVSASGPIREWLFFRYVGYWALTALWAVSCVCVGHRVLTIALRAPLPVLEQFSLSGAVGTLVFFLLMFVGGLAMLYGPVFFFALPAAMLLAGARPTYRYYRALARHLRCARSRHPQAFRPGRFALWVLGAIALFLFYIPGLQPSHIGYDSAWYHVPLAEHYVAAGGIRRFEEGWWPGSISQLSALVYAWAFMLPKSEIFDRVELAMHLEFAGMLLMLPGIPALVRRLVPRARAHVSWIAFFAFPSVYWYDLLIGGDQFSAIWSAPIALALLRAYPALSIRHCLVLAMVAAGAALTKYSESGILILPVLAVMLRMLWLPLRALRTGAAPSVALKTSAGGWVAALAGVSLTTPLWLKNWIWYGDPLHPVLFQYFASRPWNVDARAQYLNYMAEMGEWYPPHNFQGVKETLAAVFTHAFAPADYAVNPPEALRGALFTLACVCLPFVPASRRLWGVALLANLAILGWYWQMHQDRYLLAFMPVMAAVLVAVAILAYRSSLAARVAVVMLFALHGVWGLRIFTLSAPQQHYQQFLNFIVAAKKDGTRAGIGSVSGWESIGRTMPKDGKLLIHQLHLHAGLGRQSLSDWPRVQTGISYGRYRSAAEMYRALRAMGVTHVAWSTDNWMHESLAGDLRFYEFTAKYTHARPLEGLMVGTMPPTSPPELPASEQLIAFFGCSDFYRPGLYSFSDMAVPITPTLPQPKPPTPLTAFDAATDTNRETARAHYVVILPKCKWKRPTALATEFLSIGRRGAHELLARRDKREAAAP
jgi:hypothetical protein